MRTILSADEVARGLRRIAGEVAERHADLSKLVLIGIRRGGVPIAEALANYLGQFDQGTPLLGSVDITLYRDDAATALPNPRIGPSQIPGSLDGKHVLLVDDVLYTRRTVRAAIDAVLDYGRPANIELFALIDRAGRQLPIQPDYCARRIEDVSDDERVDVYEQQGNLQVVVQSKTAPSIPPAGLPPTP
jgi:pyrimidine operon attenuation protein/uracil phosphoribosyltransferase